MASVSDILTFARAQAQTDSNGLTDANGLVFANEALFDFKRKMIKSGVDASGLQESYRDGAAGTGTYLYPTDMFFLKAIELNYTDTNELNYQTATQVDVSNLPGGYSFSQLRKNASKSEPHFDDRGDWYEIFPTPAGSDNVTQLIRIFYFLEPSEYSAVSDTVSYPESLDYRILGWRVVSSYLKTLGRLDEALAGDVEYIKKVEDLIETLSRGSQQPIQATNIQLTGFEF